ncbi:hypothetical protein KW844_23750 [Chitinophaga sp. sic0106]|nr:hypothetical protein [Chitinophaga sp. sic0106]
MYPFLLALHSLVRWLVVITLVASLFNAYRGWLQARPFGAGSKQLRIATVTAAHIQLVLGICLYFISPLVHYFLQHFGEAVKMREIRFFGMEHSSMMLLSIILLTIGSAKAKRKTSAREQYKTIAIWYSIAFVILFFSIPWGFSPLTHRPYYRPF